MPHRPRHRLPRCRSRAAPRSAWRRPCLRQRRATRHRPPASRQGLQLPRGRRRARSTDEAVLTRIRALAIPPAYVDVWICAHPRGHLQATGRDARRRKQYRYHADWRVLRDRGKFGRLLAFGAGVAAAAPARAHRPGTTRPAARESAGAGGAPAGRDADPHRQRSLCARQQELRPDHAALAPCACRARPAAVLLSRQERAGARAGT